MSKRENYVLLAAILLSLLLSLSAASFIFAAETITIDTYYPAPYGVYDEMRARRIAIGDTYYGSTFCWPPAACFNLIDSNADLVVEGNVGIGTPAPTVPLQLESKGSTSLNIARFYRTGLDDNGEATDIYIGKDLSVGRALAVGYLHNVNANLAGGYLTVYGDPTAVTGVFVQKGGNVGIGTTSPGEKLSVFGQTGSNTRAIIGSASSHTTLYPGYDSQVWSVLEIVKNEDLGGNGTAGLVLAGNDTTLDTAWDGFGAIMFANKGIAAAEKRVAMISSGAVDADGNSGDLRFWTAGDGSLLEKVRIDRGGNVGIGTVNPARKLHVEDSANVEVFVRNNNPASNFAQFAALSANNNIITVLFSEGASGQGGVGTNSNHPFYIRTSSIQRMTFDTNGNVGIGTDSPGAKLQVAGDIKADLPNIPPGPGGVAVLHIPGLDIIGYDVAELFESNEKVEPGDVLCIAEDGKLKKCDMAYDTKVSGIVSEAPAIVFEGSQLHIAPQPFKFKQGNKPPVALAGRTRCKVTAQEGGEIKPGDLLVTSSKPGYAMKANPRQLQIGQVLGKALEPLDSGEGKIMVLVTLE